MVHYDLAVVLQEVRESVKWIGGGVRRRHYRARRQLGEVLKHNLCHCAGVHMNGISMRPSSSLVAAAVDTILE